MVQLIIFISERKLALEPPKFSVFTYARRYNVIKNTVNDSELFLDPGLTPVAVALPFTQ
jgi:hypothetical protein